MDIRFRGCLGLCLLLLVLLSNRLYADIKLPALLANNMVLQQDTSVTLWGWADPGETVQVTGSWNNKTAKMVADAAGNWQVKLHTPKAGGPFTVRFKRFIFNYCHII